MPDSNSLYLDSVTISFLKSLPYIHRAVPYEAFDALSSFLFQAGSSTLRVFSLLIQILFLC